MNKNFQTVMTSQAFTTKKKKQKITGLSKIAATKLSFKSPNCSKKFLKKSDWHRNVDWNVACGEGLMDVIETWQGVDCNMTGGCWTDNRWNSTKSADEWLTIFFFKYGDGFDI